MEIIDAHQHFWKFDPFRDSWITESMSEIRRNFLPEDLKPILDSNGISGCVAIQADQSETENNFLISLAEKNDFIKGIVGWVDLMSKNIKDHLAYYKSKKIIKGFRHILQGEKDRKLMLHPQFLNGLNCLNEFDFTYDILIHADQLEYSAEMVSNFSELRFVLDHIGKPDIRNREIKQWEKGIVQLGKHKNVHCKISGMITEAKIRKWVKADFRPYLDKVTEVFGTERIFYGSDWPVCNLSGNYDEVFGLICDYYSSFSTTEKEKVFSENAINFYKLNIS